jgi:aspartyl-tRNA synthetase
MELSFCDPSMIYEIIEDMISGIWKTILGVDIYKPFPRITYKKAMELVGKLTESKPFRIITFYDSMDPTNLIFVMI